MSAKACNRCGGVIVFGHEQGTGRIIPLSVGQKVYRVVEKDVVTLDPKALVPHVCITANDEQLPRPDRDFTEPNTAQE